MPKTFDKVPVATSISDQRLVTTNDKGVIQSIAPANIKDQIIGDIAPKLALDGIFIMYHRKSDNYPLMVKADEWTSLQSSGEIADGVVVNSGVKFLVVAPTQGLCYWSSAAVSGGGVTTSDRVTAIEDWAGKANTAAQIKHDECSDAAYAPGFCAAYSRTNANGNGLTAGKWWLPSVGEMMCIYANRNRINYALGKITGATQLETNWYWTSTEHSSANAWKLNLSNGYLINWTTKATSQGRVRPVSAFIS
jgi:hypothetical protein